MPGTDSIEIIIRDQTSGGDSPVSATATGEEAAVAVAADPKKAKKTATAALASNAIVAVGYIKPFVQQAVSFGISQVEMNTGSAELQRKLEAASSIGSTAISMVAAGFIGGAPAVVGAAASFTVQTVIEAAITGVEINNRKTIERENLALQKSRAGLVSNRSRGGGTI